MKKIVALALCLVMVLGLMTGCQKGMDVETLVQKMDEAMKTVTAQSADAEMNLEMKITSMGVTMNMGIGMDMDFRAKSDFSAMYMDMNMAMEALGQTEDMNMELYATMEDGAMVSYAYESTTDTWVKTVQEGYGEMLGGLMDLQQGMAEMPKEQLSLAKKQETVNDRKCYVLTVDIGGEYVQEYMGKYMGQMMNQITGQEALDEESQDAMEALKDLDWSKLSSKTIYYVDAETFLPLEGSMEILGMGEAMNSMIETLMAEMMMEMDEETPAFTMEIPTCKIVMKNMAYNDDVEIPAVPQEAIDNAVDANSVIDEPIVDDPAYGDVSTNPPQADGSYLLSLEANSVRVMVPEGYPYVNAGAEFLNAMDADAAANLSYMLVPGVTGEDMRMDVLEEVDWADDNGYYKSHSDVGELNGFDTMCLIYNDGTSNWYAWKELNGCMLLLGAEVEGETFDLPALIASVEIAVE